MGVQVPAEVERLMTAEVAAEIAGVFGDGVVYPERVVVDAPDSNWHGTGQATCYGGVRECVLHGERLRLTLSAEAADSLGMPVDTSFDLELSPQQVALLGRGLARVLTSGRADEVPQRLSIST